MILYHWTSVDNAKQIDQKGLKHGTWCIYLCRVPEDWHGEVCYEININPDMYELSVLDDWEIMCWDDIPIDAITRYQLRLGPGGGTLKPTGTPVKPIGV